MPPAGQPVLGKPGAAQAQGAAGQVGQLLGVSQDAKTGVIGEEVTAAGQLLLGPAHPRIPRAQVTGGRRPAQQRQPSALILGHVAEMLSHQRGILQVMMGRDELVPPRTFLGRDEPNH